MFKDSKQTKLLGQILTELQSMNKKMASGPSAPVASDASVTGINNKLDQIISQGGTMAGELDALTTQVSSNTDVVASAVTLINGIAAQLAAAGTDPAKLAALRDSLAASDAALAAAVAANTPAAPAPTPTA